ncbi:hypothetical protein E2C01_038006 [Portunus trituberculatus]|uniref:Uncharacterized protein n=1 Tax=Portunus trituberculatus TaxID=210409 RepID=A0A5B7FGU2_PORTR|nr:hypothetical protein [Portunus trituberculatus]
MTKKVCQGCYLVPGNVLRIKGKHGAVACSLHAGVTRLLLSPLQITPERFVKPLPARSEYHTKSCTSRRDTHL